jgi:anti-anti-sigma factor
MTQAFITIEDITSNDPQKHFKLIAISGQLDESNVDEKAQEVYAVIAQNPQNLSLIFDLEKLEYMNSKSIGYLTDWYGKITSTGGKIVLVKVKQNIKDILDVVGLTQLIQAFSTLEEGKFALTQ